MAERQIAIVEYGTTAVFGYVEAVTRVTSEEAAGLVARGSIATAAVFQVPQEEPAEA